MPYISDPSNGRITLAPVAIRVPVSLIHTDRCEHDNRDSQGADLSVGFYGYVCCEDCGADLSDDDRFNGADAEWDDGDRAYDAWKDERDERAWDGF